MSKKRLSEKIPVFIKKLKIILQDPQSIHSICWNQNGTSFQIIDVFKFSSDVLPKYFKHNNLSSFIRQLNIYGFTKIKNSDNHAYQHQEFLRSQGKEGRGIKRKNLQKQRHQRQQKKQIYYIMEIQKEEKQVQIRCENLLKQNKVLKAQNQLIKRQICQIQQKKDLIQLQKQKIDQEDFFTNLLQNQKQTITHKSSFKIIQNNKISNGYKDLLIDGKQSGYNDINYLFKNVKQVKVDET